MGTSKKKSWVANVMHDTSFAVIGLIRLLKKLDLAGDKTSGSINAVSESIKRWRTQQFSEISKKDSK